MQAIDWTAVGSGATALATFAAFLTIYITVRNYRKDLERQRAALIRQSLHTLKDQSPILFPMLREGSFFFFGSSAVAKEFRSRLDPSAGRKEFWHYFNDDDQHLLSVAVIGWYSSLQNTLPLDTIRPMEQCITPLTGGLMILSYPVQLLRRIITDTCSPIMFYNIFSAMKETSTFFQEHRQEKNIDRLTDELVVELQSNVALYFSIRYSDAIKQLNDFITTLSDNLLDLDDRKLVKISKIKSEDALAQDTRTGSMAVFLKRLQHYLPTKTYDRLLELTSKIEESVSKEKAREKTDSF
jgi:hypothetical protein